MARHRISHPAQDNAVDVCSTVRLDVPAHYVLIHTGYRTVNKALSIDADQLDVLIADLQRAREYLHRAGVETTAGVCPACTHRTHQGGVCNIPITEDIRDDVGYGGVAPTGETITIVTSVCGCGRVRAPHTSA